MRRDFDAGLQKQEDKKNSAVDNDLPPKSNFHNINNEELILMSVKATLAELKPDALDGNRSAVIKLLHEYEFLFPEESNQIREVSRTNNPIAREEKAQPIIEKLRTLTKDVTNTTNFIVPVIAENTNHLESSEYATVNCLYSSSRGGFVGWTEWNGEDSTANREFFVPMPVEKAKLILAHDYDVIGTAYLIVNQETEYRRTYKPAHLEIELVDKESKESILKLNIDKFSGNQKFQGSVS